MPRKRSEWILKLEPRGKGPQEGPRKGPQKGAQKGPPKGHEKRPEAVSGTKPGKGPENESEKEMGLGRLTRLGKTMRVFRAYVELMAAAEWLEKEASEHLECLDMRPLEFRAMQSLYHGGAQYQGELGRKIRCGKRKIQHVVEMLERAGWVARGAATLEKSPGNKRSEQGRAVKLVRLTEAGRKQMENSFPKHAKMVKSYMRALEAREQDTLARLCRKLREGDIVKFIKEIRMVEADEELDWGTKNSSD